MNKSTKFILVYQYDTVSLKHSFRLLDLVGSLGRRSVVWQDMFDDKVKVTVNKQQTLYLCVCLCVCLICERFFFVLFCFFPSSDQIP